MMKAKQRKEKKVCIDLIDSDSNEVKVEQDRTNNTILEVEEEQEEESKLNQAQDSINIPFADTGPFEDKYTSREDPDKTSLNYKISSEHRLRRKKEWNALS